jgi:hypothetical protein
MVFCLRIISHAILDFQSDPDLLLTAFHFYLQIYTISVAVLSEASFSIDIKQEIVIRMVDSIQTCSKIYKLLTQIASSSSSKPSKKKKKVCLPYWIYNEVEYCGNVLQELPKLESKRLAIFITNPRIETAFKISLLQYLIDALDDSTVLGFSSATWCTALNHIEPMLNASKIVDIIQNLLETCFFEWIGKIIADGISDFDALENEDYNSFDEQYALLACSVKVLLISIINLKKASDELALRNFMNQLFLGIHSSPGRKDDDYTQSSQFLLEIFVNYLTKCPESSLALELLELSVFLSLESCN